MKKIYVIALVIALLTGITVYSYANSLEKASKREYADVVTAAVNIPQRTALTAEMLVMKSVPAEAVMNNSVRSINQVLGLFTDGIIEKGEILSSTKLRAQEERSGGLTYFIPEGKRGITIAVDAVSGVSGFILPGDRVDILSILVLEKLKDGAMVQMLTSLVLLQNIEVLASGASIKVEENGVNVHYTTITLAVTLQEAVNLNLASANGKLRLVLRSPLDKDIVGIIPQTPDTIGNIIK